VLRQKIPRQPPTLGIKPFHVETNSKTIIISVKGTPIFLETKKKSTGLVFVTSLATDKSPTDDQLMGIMSQF